MKIQYSVDQNMFECLLIIIFTMIFRRFHVVLEVPDSFCDRFAPSDYTPATTPEPIGTPTPPHRDMAAVILGKS